MRIQERAEKLKDEKALQIRTLTAEDAEAVLEHLNITCGETDYLSKYADEVDITPEGERAFLGQMEQKERALMLGGFLDGELVVVASVLPVSDRDRMRHRGGFGMCVKKKYWGLGIGRVLLRILLEEAAQAGFEQVELEAASANERAVKLYQSCGFKTYGIRRKGIRLRDGSYFDEVLMQKELQKKYI